MLIEMNKHQIFRSGSFVIGQKLTSLLRLVLSLYIGIHWEQRLVTEFLLCHAFSLCAEVVDRLMMDLYIGWNVLIHGSTWFQTLPKFPPFF